MRANPLHLLIFTVLMFFGVGVFAQKTMLQPAVSKSVNAPKSQPQPQPQTRNNAQTPTSQTGDVKPSSTGKKTNVFLENAETFSYDIDLMADAQLLKGNVRFRHDDAILYCDKIGRAHV